MGLWVLNSQLGTFAVTTIVHGERRQRIVATTVSEEIVYEPSRLPGKEGGQNKSRSLGRKVDVELERLDELCLRFFP